MLKQTPYQPELFDQHFHNTVEIEGEELKGKEDRSKKQDELILEFFEYYHALDFTPEEIWTALFKDTKVPITSVRRAITNLHKKGKLVKTGKRMGWYDIEVNVYKAI